MNSTKSAASSLGITQDRRKENFALILIIER